MLFWLTHLASAACPVGATTSSILVDHAELATLAYANLDEASMRSQLDQARRAVPCLAELVLPADAAAVHRAFALGRFADGDPDGAMASFQAALGLQPQYRLPSSLAPPEGPMAELYGRALAAGATPTYPLPDPVQGDVYVNGSRGLAAPLGLPAIVQVVQGDGSLHFSAVIEGADELPGWFVPAVVAPVPEVQPIPPPAPPPLPPPTASGRGTLLATTIVSAIGAGALLGGSAWSRRTYDASPTASGRRLTNSLYLGSAGLGVVTVGLGIATVAIPGRAK